MPRTYLHEGRMNENNGQTSGTPITEGQLAEIAANGNKDARHELEQRQLAADPRVAARLARARAKRKKLGARMVALSGGAR